MNPTLKHACRPGVCIVVTIGALAIVPPIAIAQPITVQATLNAAAAWKMGKPTRNDNFSAVMCHTAADNRPVQATDYSSIYLCMTPNCVLAPLPAVVIADPAADPAFRPFRLHHGPIGKWGALPAAQLSGTEYNGRVVNNGPRGSMAIAQHTIRTEFDNATNAGSARLGAIVEGRQAQGGSIWASTSVLDPLEWGFDEPAYLEYLTVRIDEFYRRIGDASAASNAERVRSGSAAGVASGYLSGTFSCDDGTSYSFLREFAPLYGSSDGSLVEEHYQDPDNQPTLHLTNLQLPAGTCRLRWEVAAEASASADAIDNSGIRPR